MWSDSHAESRKESTRLTACVEMWFETACVNKDPSSCAVPTIHVDPPSNLGGKFFTACLCPRSRTNSKQRRPEERQLDVGTVCRLQPADQSVMRRLRVFDACIRIPPVRFSSWKFARFGGSTAPCQQHDAERDRHSSGHPRPNR